MSTHDLASGDAARSSDLPSARRVIHVEQVRRAVAFPYGPNVVQFSPDGHHLALAQIEFDTMSTLRKPASPLRFYDVQTWRLLNEIVLPKDTLDITLSPDWRWLAVAQFSGNVSLTALDADNDPVRLAPRPREDHVVSLLFSASGQTLIAGDAAGYLTLWQVPSGALMVTTRAAPTPRTPVSPRGARAYVRSRSLRGGLVAVDAFGQHGQLQLWHLDESTQSFTWQNEVGDPALGSSESAFSPDGRLLAVSAGEDRVETDVVRLLATATWMEVATIRVPNDFAHPICFSPDGRLLALGGAAGAVWLWDVVTQTFVASFAAHADAWDHRTGAPDWQLYALDWAPTGEYLATSGMNAVNQEPHAPTDTDPIEDTVQVWRVRVEDGAGA